MFAGRGVGRKQFSLAMSSIKTPDDVVDLFKSQGVTVVASAIDPCALFSFTPHPIVLDAINQLDIDEDTIKDNIDAYAVNHNLKEFDDKHMTNLIIELKVSIEKEE